MSTLDKSSLSIQQALKLSHPLLAHPLLFALWRSEGTIFFFWRQALSPAPLSSQALSPAPLSSILGYISLA